MLIDSHCHIDFTEFDLDRSAVIKRAAALGVQQLIVPGVSQAGWQKTIQTCAQYSSLNLALGLHPIFITEHQPQHLLELDALVEQHKPIAIGEIGLDFYRPSAHSQKTKSAHRHDNNSADGQQELNTEREKQMAYFAKQLIIAKRHDLPVIIHNRKAHDQCIKLLQEITVKGGIIHAFNGSIQQAEKYIDLGFLLGFGGMLTYRRSNKLRRLAEAIPLSSIVLETDSPDMVVARHKGTRNSPEYLPDVMQALADLKEVERQVVAELTTANVLQKFSLSKQR